MMAWMKDLWARWFGPPTEERAPLSAQQLMDQMKQEKAGAADPAAWREGVATLRSRVFSGMDRARLWRRARRGYPGDVVELELITQPTGHDMAALNDLLRDLERG